MSTVSLLVVASFLGNSVLAGPLLFLAVVFSPAAVLLTLWIVMQFVFSSESPA
jgi:hypothetical protein